VGSRQSEVRRLECDGFLNARPGIEHQCQQNVITPSPDGMPIDLIRTMRSSRQVIDGGPCA
jgi:hypothetical protein